MSYFSTSASNNLFYQNIALRTLIEKKDKEDTSKAKADSAVVDADINNDEPPEEYVCQIERKLLTSPVYLPCGHFFSQSTLDNHFANSYSCPSCGKYTFPYEGKKHGKLFDAIQKWISHKPFARNPADAPPPLPSIDQAGGGEPPTELLCPIEYTLMENPVYSEVCKHAFEKRAIVYWITSKSNPDCPICHAPISRPLLKSWTAMKELIATWQKR